MRFPNAALLIASLALTMPVLAQAEDAPAPVKPKKIHKICRDVERSGSHMVTSVCKTKAEWDGIPEADGDQYIPGNRVATGRAVNTGTVGRGAP